jgi:RHS repeat-associated protein
MTLPLVCLFSVAFDHGSISNGKERDAESGNDYFGARYYASSMGRWLSPDWSEKIMPVPYAKLDDPQSLNLYNYMRNDPLSGVDPDGHCGLDLGCWVTVASTYVATHPEVSKALDNLASSVGGKLQLSGTAKIKSESGKSDIGGAISVTSEIRNNGGGVSAVQGTFAGQINGYGGQANGTATFQTEDGQFVNPLTHLGGNVKGTLSGKMSDDVNSAAAIGTDGRVAVGVGVPLVGGKVNTPLGTADVSVQAGVQVTASATAATNLSQAVVGAVVQDTKQYVQDLHESSTCGVGGCAVPH